LFRVGRKNVAYPHVIPIKPDLILLDIDLPRIPGNVFCKYLKTIEGIKQIPVILLSADGNIFAIKRECGANDFIRKPFNISKLKSIVKKYLHNPQSLPS
jgi:DNA-binding response OmpR family regulator